MVKYDGLYIIVNCLRGQIFTRDFTYIVFGDTDTIAELYTLMCRETDREAYIDLECFMDDEVVSVIEVTTGDVEDYIDINGALIEPLESFGMTYLEEGRIDLM